MSAGSRRRLAPPAAWVVLAALHAVGCTGADSSREADIVRLGEVDFPRIQPGLRVGLGGAGFVPGPVKIELLGTVAQPGFRREAVEIVLPASAVSESEIVGEVPLSAVRALRASHGVFRGDLVVRFPPAATPGLPAVVGRRGGLVVPMVTETPEPRETRAVLVAAAAEMLGRIGLEVAVVPGPPGGQPGVVVGSVAPAAVAPTTELAPGDRLVALDGIEVTSVADLAPDPDAAYVTLSAIEGGTGRRFEVHPRLRDEDGKPGAPEALAILIALATIGLVLAVHFAGISDGIARLLAFPLVGRRPPTPQREARAAPRPRIPHQVGVAAIAVAAAAAVTTPIVLYLRARTIPVASLWAVVAGAILVHRLANVAGDLHRSGARLLPCLLRSGWALAASAAAVVPLTAAAVLALWDSAALTVTGAVASQGVSPWGWTIFRDPFALGVVLLAADRLGAGFVPHGAPAWRTVLDVAVAGAGALFLAVVCLGGWSAGSEEARVFAGLPVAAWVLEGKTLAAFAVLAWFGRRRAVRGVDARRAGLAWLAVLPLALASIGAGAMLTQEWLDGLMRPAAMGACATIATAMWVRYRQRAAPAIVEIRVEAV